MDENTAKQLRERPAEQVWLVWEDAPRRDFDDVAVAAGLRPLGDAWIEVDADGAERVVADILRTGLAYSDEHMPAQSARRLARQFILSCGSVETRYATNTKGIPSGNGSAWMPATDYTRDAGIVILGQARSALYWVADED